MPRFSLYVHIPYCQTKCPYCDFNSYAVERWPEASYVEALCTELEHYAGAPAWLGGVVDTVFFGGGTPSLFAPVSIACVLDRVRRLWEVPEGGEITLEANPGTVELDSLRGFRTAGVNRLSFGVQSFAAHHLQRLGRIHDAQQAVASVQMARQAGFDNVNIDLIFALPGQTLSEWEEDLAQACALRTEHVSAYNLTYEEGTPFHRWRARGRLRPLAEETELAMLCRGQEILGAAGYRQYEISNHAKPGYECRHNLNYWRYGAYLGVGAGAHAYAPGGAPPFLAATPEAGHGWRWSNQRSPQGYVRAVERDGHARGAVEVLDVSQARGEFVFLGLRCGDGIFSGDFRQRFGEDLTSAFPHVEMLRRNELLEDDGGWWRLTPRGLHLADSVFATFLG